MGSRRVPFLFALLAPDHMLNGLTALQVGGLRTQAFIALSHIHADNDARIRTYLLPIHAGISCHLPACLAEDLLVAALWDPQTQFPNKGLPPPRVPRALIPRVN